MTLPFELSMTDEALDPVFIGDFLVQLQIWWWGNKREKNSLSLFMFMHCTCKAFSNMLLGVRGLSHC